MPRRRQFTESFGLQLTVQERDVMRIYLKQRKLSATKYLRETAIRPIVELAQQAEVGPDDRQE